MVEAKRVLACVDVGVDVGAEALTFLNQVVRAGWAEEKAA